MGGSQLSRGGGIPDYMDKQHDVVRSSRADEREEITPMRLRQWRPVEVLESGREEDVMGRVVCCI